MSLSETVDSVPKFKEVLYGLNERYSDNPVLAPLLNELNLFSQTLSRRTTKESLQRAANSVVSLLEAMQELSEANATQQTGVFSLSSLTAANLPEENLEETFHLLSASLPSVFTQDDNERAIAVDATLRHLREIEGSAQLQESRRVVELCHAMVSVVEFHKKSLVEHGSDSDSAPLVKPLLRGFALLRTAYDCPEEPNLSPALIDSTANLLDLVRTGRSRIQSDTFDAQGRPPTPSLPPLPSVSATPPKPPAFSSMSQGVKDPGHSTEKSKIMWEPTPPNSGADTRKTLSFSSVSALGQTLTNQNHSPDLGTPGTTKARGSDFPFAAPRGVGEAGTTDPYDTKGPLTQDSKAQTIFTAVEDIATHAGNSNDTPLKVTFVGFNDELESIMEYLHSLPMEQNLLTSSELLEKGITSKDCHLLVVNRDDFGIKGESLLHKLCDDVRGKGIPLLKVMKTNPVEINCEMLVRNEPVYTFTLSKKS